MVLLGLLQVITDWGEREASRRGPASSDYTKAVKGVTVHTKRGAPYKNSDDGGSSGNGGVTSGKISNPRGGKSKSGGGGGGEVSPNCNCNEPSDRKKVSKPGPTKGRFFLYL